MRILTNSAVLDAKSSGCLLFVKDLQGNYQLNCQHAWQYMALFYRPDSKNVNIP